MSTTAKSKKLPIDRPFDKAILKQAHAIVQEYEVILRQEEDGTWFGCGLELPGAMGDGETPEACIALTRESMEVCVASMLETNEHIPAPASQMKRDVQVNIRLTRHEYARIGSIAKSGGFSSISDFARRQILATA